MIITKEIESNILNKILVECGATASDVRGKSPQEFGFKQEDLSLIQRAFNEQYGTEEFKFFFQKKSDSKGRTFELKNIDVGLEEILCLFYEYRKKKRRNRTTSIDDLLLSKPLAKENKTELSAEQKKALKQLGYENE